MAATALFSDRAREMGRDREGNEGKWLCHWHVVPACRVYVAGVSDTPSRYQKLGTDTKMLDIFSGGLTGKLEGVNETPFFYPDILD